MGCRLQRASDSLFRIVRFFDVHRIYFLKNSTDFAFQNVTYYLFIAKWSTSSLNQITLIDPLITIVSDQFAATLRQLRVRRDVWVVWPARAAPECLQTSCIVWLVGWNRCQMQWAILSQTRKPSTRDQSCLTASDKGFSVCVVCSILLPQLAIKAWKIKLKNDKENL